jgi:drug/metabolite transporter (DMT)-like permease
MNYWGIVYGLLSAVVWGSGDFFGGRAALKTNQYQAMFLGGFTGWLVLLILMVLFQEPILQVESLGWALSAGVCGAVGLASLYHGLSIGKAAIVAPTSAVVGALVTVFYSAFIHGLPDTPKLAGFALGLAGIWLTSQSNEPDSSKSEIKNSLVVAILAGLGFGMFFVLISRVEANAIFTPLVVARFAITVMGMLTLIGKKLPFPRPFSNPAGILAGIFDAGGNVFFLLARQNTRLDIASILSSLYPASTVILSWLILKQHITRVQSIGLLICLFAVGLISA